MKPVSAVLTASLLAIALFPVAGAARAAEAPTFVFSALPDQDETRLAERSGEMASYLQDRFGVPVRYGPIKSYPAAVTAFVDGDVQLAWFGGATGVQARARVPVIWRSPPFPDDRWTVRGGADATFGSGFNRKVENTPVGITDPAILQPFGRSKFIPADNAEYAPVGAVAKAAGLLD